MKKVVVRIMFVVVLGAFFSSPGLVLAEGDGTSAVAIDPNAKASFQVFYANNAFVLDADGKPSEQITKDTNLTDASVVVDAAGSLFLKFSSPDSVGVLRVFANSSLKLKDGKADFTSGEAVFWNLKGAELKTEQFKVSSTEDLQTGYLFNRGMDAFLSVGYGAVPVRVTSSGGEEFVVEPGSSVKTSLGLPTTIHEKIPFEAVKALVSLPGEVKSLKNPVAPSSSFKVIRAINTTVAKPSSQGLEFKPMAAGERYALGPIYAGVIVKLTDADALLTVEYSADGKKEIYNFKGEMTMNLYEKSFERSPV